mmetsp:Transcript_16280/g.53017  ORF Transcript_16280/g.53017 Transcript_16280/m.53017 type:complete len:309 (-) Transcript_16280:233-1159(-)
MRRTLARASLSDVTSRRSSSRQASTSFCPDTSTPTSGRTQWPTAWPMTVAPCTSPSAAAATARARPSTTANQSPTGPPSESRPSASARSASSTRPTPGYTGTEPPASLPMRPSTNRSTRLAAAWNRCRRARRARSKRGSPSASPPRGSCMRTGRALVGSSLKAPGLYGGLAGRWRVPASGRPGASAASLRPPPGLSARVRYPTLKRADKSWRSGGEVYVPRARMGRRLEFAAPTELAAPGAVEAGATDWPRMGLLWSCACSSAGSLALPHSAGCACGSGWLKVRAAREISKRRRSSWREPRHAPSMAA